MTPVLQWIKSHLVVVICSIIIIAAPVASYVVAGGMTEAARAELQDKTSGLRDLKSNRTTTVSLEVPGGQAISVTATPNQKLIDAYRVAVEKISGQAEEVHAAGLRHNQTFGDRPRGADDLLPGHFPVPSSRRAFEEMPFKLHEALVNAYAELLRQVGAGMPPSSEDVAKRLDRLRVNFVSAQRKDSVDQLDDKERAAMRADLANGRLQAYREAATGEAGEAPIRFYADAADLPVPAKPTGLLPLSTMFDWQWQYWISQDVLRAFAAANGDADVTTGPMKRLLSLSIQPIGASAAAPAGGGGGMGGMGGGMGGMGMGASGGGGMGGPGRRGGGSSTGGAGGMAELPAAPGKARIDPAAEAKIDHSRSLTGRSSNAVYDVRQVDCSIVVETSGLPAVLSAIAQSNFMTVTNLTLRPADAFAAAAEGFIYGVQPVSEVTLTIETVWLREWTADAMPPDLREQLGIQSDPPVDPAG